MLDHENPYLRIGPFKCEEKLNNPEMIIIHDFANEKSVQKIIQNAKGKLSVTPLYSGGDSHKGKTTLDGFLGLRI